MIPTPVTHTPEYTVTLAKVRADDTLKHDLIITTSDRIEAVRVRDELNSKRCFLGSNSVAQLIRRELGTRQWSLLAQVSSSRVHLRCILSHARGILMNPSDQVLAGLIQGDTLSAYHDVTLQSERVHIHTEPKNLGVVTFRRLDGLSMTRQAVMRKSMVSYLDINANCELVNDNQSGVVARHPLEEDRLTIPERFARVLWSEGIVLPLKLHANRKVLVRLTDPELRSRLALARLSKSSVIQAPPRTIPTVRLPSSSLASKAAWSCVIPAF